MGRRVLVVSQYFYPEQFRINDICRELVKLGHKVTVLTGIPNYPEGRFFKGYGLNKKRCELVKVLMQMQQSLLGKNWFVPQNLNPFIVGLDLLVH